MTTLPTHNQWSKYLRTTTGLVMLSMLATPALTFAQTAPAAKPAATDDTVIVVTGVRASQQSSINRKKNAKTATDSIVADDVGKFPDRNIGDAISRIAGVALDRGDYGEGTSVGVRGASADQGRVELDGQGVQSGGGGNTTLSANLAYGGDARSVGFAELPSDLIKTVDVVKGSTAAMTEGALGGSIIIKTRTGLDFKKPYFQLRLAESAGSIDGNWTPDINLIMSRKFFNNRLGVLVNYSTSKVINNAHKQTPGTSNNTGEQTRWDFDNSPDKTFSFNPATVSKSDAAATTPLASVNKLGGGTIAFDTPTELVTKSAAAKTKADCYAAYPLLNTTATAGSRDNINSYLDNTAKQAANLARYNELATCLAQWNDYTPSLIRSVVNRQETNRQTADIRFDYKVNDDLKVYAKFSHGSQHIKDYNLLLNQGNMPGGGTAPFGGDDLQLNTAISTTVPQNYADTGFAQGTLGTRTAINSNLYGYYTYGGISLSSGVTAATPTAPAVNNFIVNGHALPVSAVTVDSKHHVTSFTLTRPNVSSNINFAFIDTTADYAQFGGEYNHGPWHAEFLVGDAKSTYKRADTASGISYDLINPTGAVKVSVNPNGLWSYQSVGGGAGVNIYDPTNYTVLRPATGTLSKGAATGADPAPGYTYTIAQQPWKSQVVGYQWNPRMSETEEKTAKIDVTYSMPEKFPFFTNVQFGLNYRDTAQKAWNQDLTGRTVSGENTHGGKTPLNCSGATTVALQTLTGCSSVNGTPNPGYIAPVVLPSMKYRGSIVACDDTRYGTAGTAAPAGALGCNYGYVPNTALTNVKWGTITVSQADLNKILLGTIKQPFDQFYHGVPDRGNLMDGWGFVDIPSLYTLAGVPAIDFGCLKSCKASDGKVYDQNYIGFDEKVDAAYFMTEFEQQLPFGVKFNGNVGVRMVKTHVTGSGPQTFTSIVKTASYDPLNPTAAGGTETTTLSKTVNLDQTSTDWLPAYNYNLWAFDDKVVARFAINKTVARPGPSKLLPAGTCTYDERSVGLFDADGSELDQACSGTIGNPNLKPFTAKKQNTSIEYYMNKDTVFTYTVFRQKTLVAGYRAITLANNSIFSGSGLTDPATGKSLDNIQFRITQWQQDPNLQSLKGYEVSVKHAFTYLPWLLKYTGTDYNRSTNQPIGVTGTLLDPNTGTALPPKGQSAYTENLDFWYDDGATTARVAYQTVAEKLTGIAGDGSTNTNSYPQDGTVMDNRLPYSPGAPFYSVKTSYLDAKISHEFKGGVTGFIEGRNVLNELSSQTTDQGGFVTRADGSKTVMQNVYSGHRVMMGVTIKR